MNTGSRLSSEQFCTFCMCPLTAPRVPVDTPFHTAALQSLLQLLGLKAQEETINHRQLHQLLDLEQSIPKQQAVHSLQRPVDSQGQALNRQKQSLQQQGGLDQQQQLLCDPCYLFLASHPHIQDYSWTRVAPQEHTGNATHLGQHDHHHHHQQQQQQQAVLSPRDLLSRLQQFCGLQEALPPPSPAAAGGTRGAGRATTGSCTAAPPSPFVLAGSSNLGVAAPSSAAGAGSVTAVRSSSCASVSAGRVSFCAGDLGSSMQQVNSITATLIVDHDSKLTASGVVEELQEQQPGEQWWSQVQQCNQHQQQEQQQQERQQREQQQKEEQQQEQEVPVWTIPQKMLSKRLALVQHLQWSLQALTDKHMAQLAR